MIVIGATMVYLAIAKHYEPFLLPSQAELYWRCWEYAEGRGHFAGRIGPPFSGAGRYQKRSIGAGQGNRLSVEGGRSMCRLYGFRATEPTKVECTLERRAIEVNRDSVSV